MSFLKKLLPGLILAIPLLCSAWIVETLQAKGRLNAINIDSGRWAGEHQLFLKLGRNPAVDKDYFSSNDLVLAINGEPEHEFRLVPIGPLTNIALAVQQAPDIVQRVAGISIMGGSAGAGNVTPTAEFNVWADPHAAAIVFNAGFERFLMAGLNLTHQFGIDEDTIVGLREINNPVAIFAADLFDFYLSSYQERTSGQRVPLHDCLLYTSPSPRD